MKKFITLILVAGWVLSSYSQKVIQLEETMLNFDPTAEVVFKDYANGMIKVKEKYTSQFQSDAIRFLKVNFNFLEFLDAQDEIDGDFIVTATSSKGFIRATYNEEGQIIKNFQKFKDIALPYHVRNQVQAAHQGWTLTSTKYVASGLGDQISKEKYLVKLQKGKLKTKMKIFPNVSINGVASID